MLFPSGYHALAIANVSSLMRMPIVMSRGNAIALTATQMNSTHHAVRRIRAVQKGHSNADQVAIASVGSSFVMVVLIAVMPQMKNAPSQ